MRVGVWLSRARRAFRYHTRSFRYSPRGLRPSPRAPPEGPCTSSAAPHEGVRTDPAGMKDMPRVERLTSRSCPTIVRTPHEQWRATAPTFLDSTWSPPRTPTSVSILAPFPRSPTAEATRSGPARLRRPPVRTRRPSGTQTSGRGGQPRFHQRATAPQRCTGVGGAQRLGRAPRRGEMGFRPGFRAPQPHSSPSSGG